MMVKRKPVAVRSLHGKDIAHKRSFLIPNRTLKTTLC
jgi:hypothetical protein